MKKYTKPLTPEEIAKLPDEAIDYSDIPELDEEFWQNAELVMPTDVEAQRAKKPKRVRAKKHD